MEKQFEKPTLCPKCKDPKLTLWHNTGEKNGKKWGNLKCNCGYLVWDKIKQAGDWNEKTPGVFESPTDAKNSPTTDSKGQNGYIILADEIASLRKDFDERMDNMSKYLVKEIEGIKSILKMELGNE